MWHTNTVGFYSKRRKKLYHVQDMDNTVCCCHKQDKPDPEKTNHVFLLYVELALYVNDIYMHRYTSIHIPWKQTGVEEKED